MSQESKMPDPTLETSFTSPCAHTWPPRVDFSATRFVSAGQWIFRGQGHSQWRLQASLDRAMKRLASIRLADDVAMP